MNATVSSVTLANPWPGLPAYQEGDAVFFRGRQEEVAALVRLVTSERVTVLYGASGLGKTSLLQAGLFPALRQDRLLPVSVRLIHRGSEHSYDRQLLQALHQACRDEHIEYPPLDGEVTIWEYFHRRAHDLWDSRNQLVAPVFVLDQFEEVFKVSATAAERARWLSALADIVEDRMPLGLQARLEGEACDPGEFDLRKHPYRVVIGMREDFLPDLTDQRFIMPSTTVSRYRLLRMTGRAVGEVMDVAPNLIADDARDDIVRLVGISQTRRDARRDGQAAQAVDSLEDVEIDPTILSVVLRELNEERIKRGAPTITKDLLANHGGEVLKQLYERSMSGLPMSVRDAVESSLISEQGNREIVDYDGFVSRPGIDAVVIDELVRRRLLRIESRGGRRIELTHDVLAPVVFESRRARAQVQRARERARKRRRLMTGAAIAGCAVVLGLWFVRDRIEKDRLRQEEAEAASERLRGLQIVANALLQNDYKRLILGYLDTEQPGPANDHWREAFRRAVSMSSPHRVGPIHKLNAPPTLLALSSDGAWAAAGTESGTVALWNLHDNSVHALGSGGARVQRGAITGLAFAGDRDLVTGGTDGTARLWRCQGDGDSCRWGDAPFWTSKQTTGLLLGARVIQEGHDPTVLLYGYGGVTLERDGRVEALLDPGPAVRALGTTPLAPDIVVAGRDDGSIWLIDVSRGEPGDQRVPRRIGAHAPTRVSRVYAAALAVEGRRAVTAGGERHVRVWDVGTGELTRAFEGHSGSVFTIDVSREDGGRVAVTASADGTARLWDVSRSRHLATIAGHQGWVRKALFACVSPHEGGCPSADVVVVTADDGGMLRAWSVADTLATGREPTLVGEMRGHRGPILDIAFEPRSATVLSIAKDRTFRRWALRRPDTPVIRHAHERTRRAMFAGTSVPAQDRPIYFVGTTPDAQLVTASADGSVRLWRSVNGLNDYSEKGQRGLFDTRVELSALALSPGSLCMAVPGAPDHRAVKLWTPDRGSPVKADTPLEVSWMSLPDAVRMSTRVKGLAFSHDGSRLAVATTNSVHVYDVDPAGCRWNDTVPPADLGDLEHVAGVSMSSAPGGEVLAVAARGGARVWYRADGEQEFRLVGDATGHVGQAEVVALGTDGKLMASGGEDTVVRLWRPLVDRQPQFIGELLGHEGRVRALAVSDDARTVATAGDDRTIRIWDVQTLTELERIVGHVQSIYSLAFLGERVVSASADGSVRVTPCDACGSADVLARRALKRLVETPGALSAEELEQARRHIQ